MSRKKIILDVDTGVDDAQAIMLALSCSDLDVIAITCVCGNVDVDIACQNTLRVLRICNRLDVPVYKGAACSLLGERNVSRSHHGTDGLGDCPDVDNQSVSLIQKEHAVLALSRLTNQYPGEITLVALAPLTNIALVLRLDEKFGKRLQHLVIMGGCMTGSGSRASLTGDFNFVSDPEAAHVCLTEVYGPITILPYDVCTQSTFSWDQLSEILRTTSRKAQFLSAIIQHSIIYKRDVLKLEHFFTCDPLAILIACDTSTALMKKHHVVIDLNGKHTRGLSIMSNENTPFESTSNTNTSPCLCNVVLEVRMDIFLRKFKDMLIDIPSVR